MNPYIKTVTTKTKKTAYLIAIGGTGMGSLAGLLKEQGFTVTGSDLEVYPPMSDQLAALGIEVKKGWNAANIDNPDLVIIGNAVSRDNPEVLEVMRRGLPYRSLPQALGEILVERYPIVIAGTHGKTTTCSIAAWILERTGQSPGFFIGGVLKNFGRSYQLGSGDYFVIEGDEYDSAYFDKGPKFLHYRPKILILNPVEFDHADIYRDLAHVLSAFEKLLTLLPKDGLLVANWDSENVRQLCRQPPCRLIRVGFHPEADLQPTQVDLKRGVSFDLLMRGKNLGRVTSPMMGRHNTQNLCNVIAVLLDLGIPLAEINKSLAEFQGIKRRQEILLEAGDRILIEDFAHHPTAIRETLSAVRAAYPEGRLWALFEPRSNTTRRNFFQEELARAFDLADEVLLAPVFRPDKIPTEERLDPTKLVTDLVAKGKSARIGTSIDDMVHIVAQESRGKDVICLMSNGSFGGIYPKMVSALQPNP